MSKIISVPKVSSTVKIISTVLILSILAERCRAITSYRPKPIPIHREWESEVFPGEDWERGSRSTYPNVPPQPSWEEALRHSVYLTLVRDKIDELISGGETGRREVSEDDINLWREVRKAPFDRNSQERGPVFGDIAILSRGKLTETHRGFRFIEDENVKECIECHVYGARPNELEAEKKLVKPCGPDPSPGCSEGGTRALWTVRRIRHRNPEGEPAPFRYELMFSIASAKPEVTKLEYDAPSQTFTIQEIEKETGKQNRKDKVVFEDEKHESVKKRKNNYYPKHSIEETKHVYEEEKRKAPKYKDNYYPISDETEDEQEERKYWEHKKYEADRRRPDYVPAIVHREYFPGYRGGDRRPQLNTGEVYFDRDAKKNLGGYDETFARPESESGVKHRGSKKFGTAHSDEEFAEVESYKHFKGNKNIKPPTITHLHHHYYLNDKGVPILKSNSKLNQYPNFESYIPNIYKGFTNVNEDKPPSVEKYSNHFNEFPKASSPTEIYDDHIFPKITNITTLTAQTSTTPVYITPETISKIIEFANHTIPTSSRDSTISNTNTQHETIFRKPLSIQTTPMNQQFRFSKPTKPFRPSPIDTRVRFSELDPLYPPTVSTTKLYKTTEYQGTSTALTADSKVPFMLPKKHDKEKSNIYENSQTAPTQMAFETTEIEKVTVEEITQPAVERSSPVKTTRRLPFTSATPAEEESTQITITRPIEEITTIDIETTQIANPEPVTNLRESIPKKKIERTFKPNRRVKLQKKFSELVNAQMSPPPDTIIDTTVSYTTPPVSQSVGTTESTDSTRSESKKSETLENILSTKVPVTRKKINNLISRRNTRLKYERKPTNLAARRVKLKVSTVKTVGTTPESVLNVTESQIELDSNVDNITDVMATNDYNNTTIENFTVEIDTEKQNDTVTAQTRSSKLPYIQMKNETSAGDTVDKVVEEKFNVTTAAKVDPVFRNVTRKAVKFSSKVRVNKTRDRDSENTRRATTAPTTESSNSKFSERQDEIFTPLTRKSYVTSISLKLGNKTRPYYPTSTESPKNESVIVKKKVQLIENSTFMDDLLNEFNFDKATKAKISEVTSSGAFFKVYKAEENSGYSELETQNDEMDNLTQQIIEHAKSVNLFSLNVTNNN